MIIHRFFRVFLAAFVLAAALPSPARAAPEVAVSILPIHSLVAAVMRGAGEPRLIMPAGQSPHGAQLKPSQVRQLNAADLIIWVGPHFEQSIAKPIAEPRRAGARVVTLMEDQNIMRLPIRAGGLWEAHAHGHDDEHEHDEHDGHEDEHDDAHDDDHDGHAEHDEHHDEHDEHDEHHDEHDEHADEHHDMHDDLTTDPHIWLSVANARVIAERAAHELAEIDPQNAARYQANLREVLSRLAQLRNELAASLDTVKAGGAARYVVFHDAYHYFEDEFGLQPLGSLTVSPELPPGAKRVVEIRQAIRDRGAQCVFSEPQFQPSLARQLAADTGAALGVLDPLGAKLTPGPQAWFDLLRALADALVECLE